MPISPPGSPTPLTEHVFSTSPVEDLSFRSVQWENHPTTPPNRLATDGPSNSTWKGKGKEVLNASDEVDLGQGSFDRSTDPVRETLQPERVGSYPPLNDDELEERKITENLKRWELLEKQRRKSARESRNSTSSVKPPPPRTGDVTRRASLFWRSGSRKPGVGSTMLASEDDLGLPTNPDNVLQEVVDDLQANDPPPSSQPFRTHKSTHSRDSQFSTSSASTITPENVALSSPNDPRNPFSDPTPEMALDDPFNATEMTPTTPTIPQKRISLRVPTPRPLGLPTFVNRAGVPPSPAMTRDARHPRDDSDPDENDGRWWTDWLCGCREASRRGSDDQAGRTNPFE